MTTDREQHAEISHTLARYRAQRISDLRYRLECWLTASALRGKQQIRFHLGQSFDRNPFAIDWRPQLSAVEIAYTVRSLTVNDRHHARTAYRNGRLEIPAQALDLGENRIDLEWRAPIQASGSALTRYKDRVDGSLYVHSLFVPADASTVFPCFDQPDLKARFTLLLSIPMGWTAIANAPAVARKRVGRRLQFTFDETEPISTYAFAFAAGPFAGLRTRENPTRLWVRRSQRRSAQRHVREVLRLNREAVRYCAHYFGHPFPFRKYDLVLIPQFPYRGMEHAGATFLDEAAVLLSKTSGEAARFQRAQLIFHETAHQWMGDLVTMRWFDDLWIKEGYANFIAYKLAEHTCSREYARLAFHDLKISAYEVDGSPGATALHHPVADLVQAKSAYNALVYAKAPAVLRMLEHLLGARVFRDGMRALVNEHAYGAVDCSDLIAALEWASGRSLARWAGTWLLRPGAVKVNSPRIGIRAHEYALIAPNRDGVARAVRRLAHTHDALGRKHIWEYLWTAVRNRTLDPLRFAELALSQAAAEHSPLTLTRLAEQLRIVIDRLLDSNEQGEIIPELEALAWGGMQSSESWEIRLAWTRALIRWSRTSVGYERLHMLLSSRHRALGFTDRLAIAGALVAGHQLTARRAVRMLALEAGSAERGIGMHCLRSASPRAEWKHEVFMHWIEDASLPEYWIDAALPYLNHPTHARITLPLLQPALGALPMLARTRKIFFVNRWLAAFLDGQCSDAALEVIDKFLDRRGMAPDLRLKVLAASHALQRDVAVYRRWHR